MQILACKTYNINAANLVLALVNKCILSPYLPSKYSLIDNRFIQGTPGEFACSFNLSNFRDIQFTNSKNIKILDRHFELAQTKEQSILLGCHDYNNFSILKTRYGNQCKTIGVVWTQESYNFLLDNFTRYHLFYYKIDQSQFLKYRDELDTSRLVKTEYSDSFDFAIDVGIFLDSTKLINSVNSICNYVSPEALSYYETWRQHQAAWL